MVTPTFHREIFRTILTRVTETRRFIQVLAGPRQAGKTTLALQVAEASTLPSHYASADEPALKDREWLKAQWEIGRIRAREAGKRGALLVLDEVQKIPGWSDTVKNVWDEDTLAKLPLKVLLLGSAPLLIQHGLTESLAGRFELIRVSHWSFKEMREAFDWNVEQFVFFGGYPGAAPLIKERDRWAQYIQDSLIETTLSRDILLLTRIDKPALLRQLFRLGCDYSAQILSYQKMVGQLQDAGNTTTLAHYLELLSGAGIITGLQKYSGARVRQRGSSPKLLALNTALISAHDDRTLAEARADRGFWGRLVESAVGAHLVNSLAGTGAQVTYWRERRYEIDYIIQIGKKILALEVTSGRRKDTLPGMAAFGKHYEPTRTLLVGGQGISLEEFLSKPSTRWVT